jgi:hypothetical protein
VKVPTILLLREMPITIVLEIWQTMIKHVLGDVVTTPTINFALPIITHEVMQWNIMISRFHIMLW